MLAEAPIWTWWMAVGLVIGVVFAVLTLVVAYFRNVVRPKYPPRGAQRS